MDFNAPTGDLLETILNFDGDMTVFDDEKFPQYLYYDENAFTISPLTEENTARNETWKKSRFENLSEFFRLLRLILSDFFAEQFGK